MATRIFLLLTGLLGGLLSVSARADTEMYRLGPYTVETGSWTAHVIRRDNPMRCPLGTATDCYFVYIDIRNVSDQTLDCRAEVRYDNGGAFLASGSATAIVNPRAAYSIVVLNAGARITPNFAFAVNCTARPATSPPPPPGPGPSGDIELDGASSYRFSGDYRQLTVQVERVSNYRSGGTSGTLTVEVWLTTQRGGNQGTRIAEINIGTLQGGYGKSVDRTVAVSPPTGTYYVTYLLKEYGGNTLDRVDFDRSVTIGSSAPPPPTPPPAGEVGITGTSSYDFSGDRSRLTVGIERVQNGRASGVSGTLTVEVWLTEQYGSTQGYKIGEIALGTLQAGTGMSVNRTISITPPAGTFYVVYRLLEAGVGTADLVNFDRPVTISSTGIDDTASGGGGALDIVGLGALALFGLWAAWRRRLAMAT